MHNKTTDVKTLVQQYNDGMAEIMDKHAPMKIKKINIKHHQPYAYRCFSFCLISCNKVNLKNRINNFLVETSFHQFSNMGYSLLQRRCHHEEPPDGPKDQDPMLKKNGVIYRYKYDRVECDEDYIGESSRTFGERFKEHQKAPSPIYDHYNISDHLVSIDNFSIVGREDQNLMRIIKEALYLRVNNPSLKKYRQVPPATHLG